MLNEAHLFVLYAFTLRTRLPVCTTRGREWMLRGVSTATNTSFWGSPCHGNSTSSRAKRRPGGALPVLWECGLMVAWSEVCTALQFMRIIRRLRVVRTFPVIPIRKNDRTATGHSSHKTDLSTRTSLSPSSPLLLSPLWYPVSTRHWHLSLVQILQCFSRIEQVLNVDTLYGVVHEKVDDHIQGPPSVSGVHTLSRAAYSWLAAYTPGLCIGWQYVASTPSRVSN